MLSISTIQSAVEALLKERYPGEEVYRDLVPSGFTRPSFLVECGPVKMADADCMGLEVSVTVTVTVFVAVDEYHNSQIAVLQMRMMDVQALFAIGYLEAGERALHVAANEGNYEYDFATVRVTFSYLDDRPSVGETVQDMGAVNTKIQIKEV